MFILIEGRAQVVDVFAAQFAREGFAMKGFHPSDFGDWLSGATKSELAALEGILIGESPDRVACARAIRDRCGAPIIALNDVASLEQTLDLFACGVDDVVRKPVHVREILARARAIRRRVDAKAGHVTLGAMRIYFDGRDPDVEGEVLSLPRRERRILEFLAAHRGRRVTKSQIFNAIYGLFDEDVEESVVESHVSKLRKKLRCRIGYDPIDSKRFLGYCLLEPPAARPRQEDSRPRFNPAPVASEAELAFA